MGTLFNVLIQYRGWKIYDLPRSIFSTIDYVIFWGVARVYELIEDLAHVSIFGGGTLDSFYSNIYALLSIFMLFKLSFSVIGYILDPAKVSDKNVGVGKIITNIIVMFTMMLSAPVAFKYLTKLQNAILDDNVIENFVFSVSGEKSNAYEFKIVENDEICANWHEVDENFEPKANLWEAASMGDAISLKVYRSFLNLSEEVKGRTGAFAKEDVFDAYYFCNGMGNATVKDMTEAVNDYVEKSGKGMYYVMEYRMFLSTIVGGYVLLMFISIAFDTAVRSVKLGFLQLIAPIPIMSYIDPKGQKGMFSKWIKEVGKTWASLFIRLFSVYFATFVISRLEIILPKDYTINSSNFFIELFIIIGALMFAKQLPRLLEDIFPGMKMGKMELNPFKNVAENAIGGKAILGAGAAVGASALGGVTNIGSRLFNSETWKNADGKVRPSSIVGGIAKTLSSGVAGAGSSAFRAAKMTSKDGKIFKGAWTGYQESNKARFVRDDNKRKAGVKTFTDEIKYTAGSIGADLSRLTGNLTRGQRDQIREQEMKADLEAQKNNLTSKKNTLAVEKASKLEPIQNFNKYSKMISDKVSENAGVKEAKLIYEATLSNRPATFKNSKERRDYDQRIINLRNDLDRAKQSAYEGIMKSDVGQEIKKITDSYASTAGINVDYTNFESFKKAIKTGKDMETTVSLEFIPEESRIAEEERRISTLSSEITEFTSSKEYKMHQVENSDRSSKGTLKPGENVTANVGNITDNPYYNPGYYGNNMGPGKPPTGGNEPPRNGN